MAAATSGHRKIISIYDYPEHLNPFREEETNSKMRFWTLGRKLKRSNSITLSGIKDFRNSWTLKSFMKKGKKEQSSTQDKTSTTLNGESSPVQFRKSLQYSSPSTTAAWGGERNTVSSPERYVYGGSVTPLPRSRFQERLRSPSQYEVNSLRVGVFDRASASPRLDTASLASDVTGSRLSVESTNPFEEGPVPPVRASRRKKKRAPPPPPSADTSINTTLNLSTSEQSDSNVDAKNKTSADQELEIDSSLNIELKIVEDEDPMEDQKEELPTTVNKEIKSEESSKVTIENEISIAIPIKEDEEPKSTAVKDINHNQRNGDKNNVNFAKVDIRTYRRNSSFNEDDVKLRRGNLEDFNITANKRSKSLSNTNDNNFDITYDINLNTTEEEETDANCNEPKRVVCKLFNETTRKHSIDNSVSSTEKEFIEIDRATRELEREINKLNSALKEDEPLPHNTRLSVSEIKRKFDNADPSSPNPIPKPRRSNFASPANGNVKT